MDEASEAKVEAAMEKVFRDHGLSDDEAFIAKRFCEIAYVAMLKELTTGAPQKALLMVGSDKNVVRMVIAGLQAATAGFSAYGPLLKKIEEWEVEHGRG
jgi:hypothetical protein